jgi:hypothetical protein
MMLCWNGRDAESGKFRCFDRIGFPHVESDGIRQSSRGMFRGKNFGDRQCECSSGVIEIVLMLMMAQQHQIDGREIDTIQRRIISFRRERSETVVIHFRGTVERRIGENSVLADLQQDAGSVDMSDGDFQQQITIVIARPDVVCRDEAIFLFLF